MTEACVLCVQNVPVHHSFTVLFKYFGGGEVEFKSHIGAPKEG